MNFEKQSTLNSKILKCFSKVPAYAWAIMVINALITFFHLEIDPYKREMIGIGLFQFILFDLLFLVWMVKVFRASSAEKKLAVHHELFAIVLLTGMATCFGFNRELEVIPSPSNYVKIALVFPIVFNLLFALNFHAKWREKALLILLAPSLFIIGYFCIWVIPLMPVGLLGLLAFGIGILVFLPYLFFIFILVQAIELLHDKKPMAIILVLLFLISIIGGQFYFLVRWNIQMKELQVKLRQLRLNENSTEDERYIIADALNKMEPKFIIDDLELLRKKASEKNYSSGPIFQGIEFFHFRKEGTLHPIKELILGFGEPLPIDPAHMDDILEMKDQRFIPQRAYLHEGQGLEIASISTDLSIFAKKGLVYFEKIIEIQASENENNEFSWVIDKEAIIDITLPPGTVISGVSLWINGVEKKAEVASKLKANNAYRNIVGVQNRDPILVEYIDEAEVRMRIFPVSRELPRKCRIGFVQAMKKVGKSYRFQDVVMNGLPENSANYYGKVRWKEKGFSQTLEDLFSEQKGNMMEGSLEASFPRELLIQGEGVAAEKVSEIPVKNVYYDLHQHWDKASFLMLVKKFKNSKQWIWNQTFKEVSEENALKIFHEFSKHSEKLFPLQKVEDSSLVIMHQGKMQLKKQHLAKEKWWLEIEKDATIKKGIQVFSIQGYPMPIYHSLCKEKDWLFQTGSALEANYIIQNTPSVHASLVAIKNDILSHENQKEVTKGIDAYIAKLYAWNISEQVKPQTHQDSVLLLQKLLPYYIVSKYTSLVVLESQKDYEEQEIGHIEGWGNSSMKDPGAAPEPHEWVLIISGALVLVIFLLRKNVF